MFTKRLLPTFDTYGTEALKHGEEWFRGKAASLNPLDDDQYEAAAYFADKAMDETLLSGPNSLMQWRITEENSGSKRERR